ncbi:MAG TPA: polysaccharide deacetylase family protein [Patescibacteria group bacterium]|nr:polysaccharide deacetylase family protein [Patescibacteria group bacterium]
MKKWWLGGIILLIAGIWCGYGVLIVPETTGKSSGNALETPLAKTTAAVQMEMPAVGVPVLMYHSVAAERDNDAVISRERFAEHMDFLQQRQYQPISLDQLYSYLQKGEKLPSRPVVITFDDGYRDTYEVVLPILKQHGFKSVLFLSVGEMEKRLKWQEVREMKAAGMEIASHGVAHKDLTGMSREQQRQDIMQAKEILDRQLQQDTRYFCYPNGRYNQDTLEVLQAGGFLLAVTIDPGWAKKGDPQFALQRIWMGNAVDLKRLEERLSREDYPVI